MQPSRFFLRKRLSTLAFILLVLVITIFFMSITKYDIVKGFVSIPKALFWAVSNFYPTWDSLSRLPNILQKLLETVLMSIAATTAAAGVALVFAVLGSNTTRINAFFSTICRGIALVFRNVDVAVWALILLFSFGQSALTGFFALFFVTFGYLTRVFMETIDEASPSSVEALRATGSGYLAVVAHSVLPNAMPQMMSWTLFIVETNIRSATLIGLLTGTGIGFAFEVYYKSLNYHAASLVVIAIIVAILGIETISNYVRRAIL